MQTNFELSTGLPELDRLIRGVIPGDNVVLRVGDIGDYRAFARPYARYAVTTGRKLIYFRFAGHEPVLSEDLPANRHTLDPRAGFEILLDQVHGAIEQTDRGAFYVFDNLSELAVHWHSDQMLANFFMLTCPYLLDRGDVAYFALMRGESSPYATDPIRNTCQVFLEVYRNREHLFVRPLKVQQRYSPTMHMLHRWDREAFEPVTDSCTISEVLSDAVPPLSGSLSSPLDVWNRAFLNAEEQLRQGVSGETAQEAFEQLLHMLVTRDGRVSNLARRYFTIEDVLEVRRRTIGTGLIGGKSVGMLLARAILKRSDPRWRCLLEEHDSFYIASDVFYTFLVRNGCWWLRRRQKDSLRFLEGAELVRRRITTGTFPDEIEEQFVRILEYFGQSPIIVRSSSLLEDNFGNSFAGKYESVFCANQGSQRQRLDDFLSAVKTVYASAMGEEALAYRARHNLLERDEQMALLVQRVSGATHGNLYYPHVAGVGFSFNPYVWSEEIDPEAGVLRLVFGLGTRAVNRSDDDYTRVVALNAPERRPEGAGAAGARYVQRKVDVLDLDANRLVTADFADVAAQSGQLPLHLFATSDPAMAREARAMGKRTPPPMLLDFEQLLAESTFVENMRTLLAALEEAYGVPVDMEFTANFQDGGAYRINLVQCRPLQVRGSAVAAPPPRDIPERDLLIETLGPVIGPSRTDFIERFIYIAPASYARLQLTERYAVARLVGRLTHLHAPQDNPVTMLLGPGRWGTTTPSLGVPVSFAEINTVAVLCEIVAMRDDLVPDVSLGTHFFGELVEMDILYFAVFPYQEGTRFERGVFEEAPNRLTELLPDAAAFTRVVHLVDARDISPGAPIRVHADVLKQRLLCYIDRRPAAG
ncbi:MAG: pyruvate, phosphate dikinase [Candidatus Hydrogenedentes bacterium]|nr:pyruvate, phosphate dikinase [Candidatus Hydrogenedentota bacterium]